MRTQTLIFLSTTDWDAPQFGSRQQIALQMARQGQRVLFVDQPRALHSLISDRRKSLLQMRRWLTNPLRQPHPDLPNLQVYAPPPVLPIFYHPLTNTISQKILKRAIRRTLQHLGWQADIFWTYWANSDRLVGAFGETLAVYHCIDNYRATGYPLVAQSRIIALEEALCRKVDWIITRTAGLADLLRPCCRRVDVIGGGVDMDLFNPQVDYPLPLELGDLERPLAGLVGTLDNRLNIPLISQVAQRLPDVTFVLAGHLRAHLVDISPLAALPNVHLVPAQPHERVPAFVAHFDVCLIPYEVNEYTREVSPLKLYEFLAMGKPVVATPLPYLCQVAEQIYIASSGDKFATAIGQALAEPVDPTIYSTRRQIAEAQAWSRQVTQINDILDELASLKTGSSLKA